MPIGNMHNKVGEDWTCSFGDTLVNRQTHRQTDILITILTSRPASTSLTELLVSMEDDVQRIIMSSPTKSCTLDPVPTYLLKESLHILLPYITAIVNALLREGHVSVTQKHAIITPLIK